MRLALDTNRYRDLTDGDEAVRARVAGAERVYVPFVVAAELKAGFALGRKGRENERTLNRFLMKPGVDLLFADEGTLVCYANVYRHLREQGTPIPTNDLWIAALVLEHGLALYTRDEHFRLLPEVSLIG